MSNDIAVCVDARHLSEEIQREIADTVRVALQQKIWP